MEGYTISSNTDDMDLNVIHAFLSKSYWAKGIPLETVAKSINNSLCFGVFTIKGEQVGFARMITDRATFAYLGDVFILENHRAQGLSKWLMRTILEHPDLQGLRRISLATNDAHSLYEQFGFKPLAKPQNGMECWDPDVYQETNPPI